MDMICEDANPRRSSSVNAAAVGITLGTIIITLTIIIMVLIIICCVKRRRKGKAELIENNNEVITATNEAYNKVINDVIASSNTNDISQTITTDYEETEFTLSDNIAYEGVIMSDNTAYVQSSSDHSQQESNRAPDTIDIHTSHNVSYEGTVITTSDNPAYIPTHANDDNYTLEYDYVSC